MSLCVRVCTQGATMGRRELAELVHSWATLEWEMGGDVNATRALFAKAVALDAQVHRFFFLQIFYY